MSVLQNRRKKPYILGSVLLLSGAVGIFGWLAIQGPMAIRVAEPSLPAVPSIEKASQDSDVSTVVVARSADGPTGESSR